MICFVDLGGEGLNVSSLGSTDLGCCHRFEVFMGLLFNQRRHMLSDYASVLESGWRAGAHL